MERYEVTVKVEYKNGKIEQKVLVVEAMDEDHARKIAGNMIFAPFANVKSMIFVYDPRMID